MIDRLLAFQHRQPGCLSHYDAIWIFSSSEPFAGPRLFLVHDRNPRARTDQLFFISFHIKRKKKQILRLSFFQNVINFPDYFISNLFRIWKKKNTWLSFLENLGIEILFFSREKKKQSIDQTRNTASQVRFVFRRSFDLGSLWIGFVMQIKAEVLPRRCPPSRRLLRVSTSRQNFIPVCSFAQTFLYSHICTCTTRILASWSDTVIASYPVPTSRTHA